MTILPFLGSNRKKRKVMAQEVKEFSELVKDQYTFLMKQLEKVLKDYFDLSSRVKEMHTEIFSLRGQLAQAAALQCINKECAQRSAFLYPQERGYKIYPSDRTDRCAQPRFQQGKYRDLL